MRFAWFSSAFAAKVQGNIFKVAMTVSLQIPSNLSSLLSHWFITYEIETASLNNLIHGVRKPQFGTTGLVATLNSTAVLERLHQTACSKNRQWMNSVLQFHPWNWLLSVIWAAACVHTYIHTYIHIPQTHIVLNEIHVTSHYSCITGPRPFWWQTFWYLKSQTHI
jgi:hypothetical protein